ncbi:hypothetical protein COHA_007987 [Chlorella ohadii]|uniref:Uncharacterized protein n=1 Tax=Chlorella ohadii TaxID=2649997 RepID=A0AAD5DIC0_9CHLO|nr:hypothetical protein COHA_007987 [Chlorella ohadii]
MRALPLLIALLALGTLAAAGQALQGDDELGLVPEVEFEEDELDFPPLNSRKLLACRTKIGIKNKTGNTIYFYLRYRDGGPDQWITSEEFSVKPNSYNRPVTTDNSIWYYYAYSDVTKWDGKGRKGAVQIDTGSETYWFRKVNMGTKKCWKTYTRSLIRT